jgi:hypothetical protein
LAQAGITPSCRSLLGFVVTETKENQDWREQAREVRYDLKL